MKDRILAAWSVLRGTHKAVPMEASWYIATAPLYTTASWPTTTSTTSSVWIGGNA